MIFNKDGKGSDELKSLIGFIYKSIDFANLKTYLVLAKREIIQIIGREVYAKALEFYKSSAYDTPADPDTDALLRELVLRIQLPLSLIAYRKYAPGADLTHNDSGRQITVTETVKPAFEWMIKRDNANITSLANEAIDFLLEFLDTPTWIHEEY